jgi:pimeloyl-ACP methyl ester carboxylesterase
VLGTLIAFAGLLSPHAGTPASPGVTPAEFRGWFEAAREGRLAIPATVERGARRFRYVFVGGFRSERMPGYFARNAKELRARGVSQRAIDFIYPSSDKTIGENADGVRSEFFEIARKGPEKLVVIAHSRGACDALAFALHDPGFVRDRVEALFLVQGPFGGTALADYIQGEGPPVDRRMPARFRAVVPLLAALERSLLRRGRHGGLADMAREESRRYWSRMLDARADAVPVVGAKTYFIRSETLPSRLGLFRRAAGWYLSTYGGPNDGVVAVDDQRLPGLGTSLGVFDCGHNALTRRTRSGREQRRLQGALIDSIVMAVGRIGPGPSVAGIDPADGAPVPPAAANRNMGRRASAN